MVVILTPISLFRAIILVVTIAMESPKDRASLSIIFTCLPLKKTSVHVNPGKKKIIMIPIIALTGVIKPNISDSHSML